MEGDTPLRIVTVRSWVSLNSTSWVEYSKENIIVNPAVKRPTAKPLSHNARGIGGRSTAGPTPPEGDQRRRLNPQQYGQNPLNYAGFLMRFPTQPPPQETVLCLLYAFLKKFSVEKNRCARTQYPDQRCQPRHRKDRRPVVDSFLHNRRLAAFRQRNKTLGK